MQNTKFLELYKLINENEIKFFRNFMLSEITMKNKHTLNLFEYLFSRRYLSQSNLNKKRVYAFIYKNEPYNDLRMRHLLSEATETLEYYFSYRKFHFNSLQQEIYLVESLVERNEAKQAYKNLNDSFLNIENQKLRNEFYYSSKVQLINLKYKIETEHTRKDLNNYQDMIDVVLQHSMLSIFKHTCLYLVNNQFADNQSETYFIQHFLNEINNKRYEQNILLQVYINMYKMLTLQDSNIAFYDTKKIIDTNQYIVDTLELKDIYLILSNYCIKKYNKNELQFGEIYLNIIENGIQNKFILDNKELNRFTFTNYITIALKLNRFDNAKVFINQYKSLINIEYRENTLNYNLARLFYIEKDYKKAMRILVTLTLQDVFWELNAKVIQLKIYYDTNELEVLENTLISFYQYLKRKKDIGYHKIYFEQIVKEFKFLLNTHNKTKKQINEKLAFLQQNNIPEKDWLIENLSKFKK